MVGIVYATRREADPFLASSAARPLSIRPVQLFRTAGDNLQEAIVAVSGMGKVAAALAATHLVLAHHVSVLINAGLCGRLTRAQHWPVGHLLRIGSAVEGDCDRLGRPEAPVACDDRWFCGLASARLVTSDRPVFSGARRVKLAAVADLADMEGAAVARVAQCYGIPCVLVKGVSDSADASGRRDINRHIDGVSRSIADALVSELTIQHADEHP